MFNHGWAVVLFFYFARAHNCVLPERSVNKTMAKPWLICGVIQKDQATAKPWLNDIVPS